MAQRKQSNSKQAEAKAKAEAEAKAKAEVQAKEEAEEKAAAENTAEVMAAQEKVKAEREARAKAEAEAKAKQLAKSKPGTILRVRTFGHYRRRRAGMSFSAEPVDLLLADLTKGQVQLLEKDSMLKVQRIEAEGDD